METHPFFFVLLRSPFLSPHSPSFVFLHSASFLLLLRHLSCYSTTIATAGPLADNSSTSSSFSFREVAACTIQS